MPFLIRFLAWSALVGGALSIVACGGDDSGEPAGTPSTTAPSATASTRDAERLQASGQVAFYGGEAGDNLTATAIGDFNGDGQLDAAFAAAFADGPSNERPDAGEIYVLLGPLAPNSTFDVALGQQTLTILGADSNDQAGRALAAGDVDGDGIDDIIIGVPNGDGPAGDREDAGEVLVVRGSPGLVPDSRTLDLRDGSVVALYGAGAQDLFGLAVDTGDVNGDGISDIAVGALWADGPEEARGQAGEVYVFTGGSALSRGHDLAQQAADSVIFGADPEGRLGESLAVGDVNGDGVADLVVVSTFSPGTGTQTDAGRTYVILSPPPASVDLASTQAQAVIIGTDDGDQLGHSLAIGDYDGDGLGDLLLGAVSADGLGNTVDLAGEAALVPGANLSGVIDTAAGGATAILYGVDEADRLGRSVAFLDLDGDGDEEPVLAAPGSAGRGNELPDAGELYVVMADEPLSGDIQLPDSALAYEGSEGDMLGSSVTGKPALFGRDVNGDGREELIAAAGGWSGTDGQRPGAGAVFILFFP